MSIQTYSSPFMVSMYFSIPWTKSSSFRMAGITFRVVRFMLSSSTVVISVSRSASSCWGTRVAILPGKLPSKLLLKTRSATLTSRLDCTPRYSSTPSTVPRSSITRALRVFWTVLKTLTSLSLTSSLLSKISLSMWYSRML